MVIHFSLAVAHFLYKDIHVAVESSTVLAAACRIVWNCPGLQRRPSIGGTADLHKLPLHLSGFSGKVLITRVARVEHASCRLDETTLAGSLITCLHHDGIQGLHSLASTRLGSK